MLTSYIVSAAIAMPLVGWLADRLGVKHLFLASVIGFTLASAGAQRQAPLSSGP